MEREDVVCYIIVLAWKEKTECILRRSHTCTSPSEELRVRPVPAATPRDWTATCRTPSLLPRAPPCPCCPLLDCCFMSLLLLWSSTLLVRSSVDTRIWNDGRRFINDLKLWAEFCMYVFFSGRKIHSFYQIFQGLWDIKKLTIAKRWSKLLSHCSGHLLSTCQVPDPGLNLYMYMSLILTRTLCVGTVTLPILQMKILKLGVFPWYTAGKTGI